MATPRPTKKPSASPLPEDDSKKSLDSDDKAFIQKLVADSHQDIYFQGWVDLYYNDKDPKKRILVITNFRVITIKVNVLGRSVRQQFPLLDLTKLQVKKENFNQITLEFGTTSPAALINYEKSVIGIAQVILFAYQAITFGRPPDLLPKVDLPHEFLSSYLPPEPDAQDGLLATYLAECDYNKLEQRIPVLDYLMTCFQLDDRVLDLGECLAFIDKENKTDVHALASALKYSKWFTEITAVNFPLKNEGLQSISTLLTVPSAITKLVLVNIKAGRFAALSKAISQGTHSLNFLNLSKNPIGDQGLKLLMDGLQESKKVLHTLCLRNCGFTNKGLKSLFTVLSQPYWLAGLKILDISDNPLGKSGTQDMCQWLSLAANAIEQLYIVNVDLVPEILFPTLEANKPLITTHLVSLNISGNKLSKKAVPDLCKVLTKTGSLSQLYLSNAGVTRTSFVQIIDFCLQNTTRGLGFSLDFSSNHLGVKGVKDLDTLFMDWLKKDNKKLTESGKLHTLVLSDNDLGTEGIQLVCKALKSTSIHTLSLDRNMKVGMFNSGKEAGEALASLINDTPHLKELTVAGSDSLYMKGALLPLLAALGTNGSLRHLDISKNKLGDQGIIKLAEALATNSSLTTFNAEGNKINVRGLQALHEATSKNKTLIDWVIPMEDVQKLVRAPGDKKTTDMVLKIVHELELNMERNQKALRSSEVKVGGMTSQELESILGQRGIPSMRMSTVGDDGYLGETQSSKHRKTHSRLLDLMQQSEGRGGGGGVGVIHTPISSGPSTPVRPKPAPPSGTSPVSAEVGTRAPAVPASILKTVKPMNVGPIGSPRSVRSMSPTPRPPTTPTAAGPSSPAPTPSPAVHASPTPTPPPTAAPSPPATPGGGDEWKTKHYPFEKLESNVTAEHLPPGVRSDIRELYLDNDKFHDLFELTKEEYLKLPKWKQSQLKKKNGLF